MITVFKVRRSARNDWTSEGRIEALFVPTKREGYVLSCGELIRNGVWRKPDDAVWTIETLGA